MGNLHKYIIFLLLISTLTQNLNYFEFENNGNKLKIENSTIFITRNRDSLGKNKIKLIHFIKNIDDFIDTGKNLKIINDSMCKLTKMSLVCIIFGNEIKHLYRRQINNLNAFYSFRIENTFSKQNYKLNFEINNDVFYHDEELMEIVSKIKSPLEFLE